MIDKKTDNIAAKSDFFIKKHRAQGTEHRARGTGHRAQSTGHGAQGTEHRPQDRKTARLQDRKTQASRSTKEHAASRVPLAARRFLIKESSRKMLKEFPEWIALHQEFAT